ncbi:uncharacterized protein LOC128138502, partial [Harpia harpyja]|uniref:uncharacterized protein LOC128138502 n=1 Tax=Harpia harpyja TaxID=202280 RepID=UPI0022B11FE2
MRGLPVFRPTPKSLPSSSWGGKGLREAGVPPGPTGGSQGLRVQILLAFNSIFPVGEEEQVDSAEPSGDQAAATASLRQMANAFATIARASVRCVDRSDAEIGKRTSRARRKVTRCRSAARFPPALAPEETAPAAACSQKRTGFCTTSDDEMLGLFVLYGTPGTGNSILFQSAAEPARSSTLCRLHRCGWDRAVLHIPKATKSHPCPCCFAGSFCDASDVLGADLLDCSYSMPDRQLVRRVASQVEFHLSDENLAKDAFLLKHVQRNKVGFVSIKLLTSLKKVGSPLRWPAGVGVSSTGFSVSWVPIPESLLSIPPSKLLLAWELLLLEQDMLLLLQKNFLKTITRMFSPFGTIASIRILRPGRKLPSGVRKYTSDFPELLSKHCALVEYKSLGSASALRSLEDLGRQSGPRGESIRVVRLCGKGSKKTPGAEREVAEELVDQPGWKAQAVAATFPDGLGDSLLCSFPELNGAQALPPLLLHKDPSAPSRPGSNFKPSNFGNGFNGLLLASKVFPPLGTGLGTGSCYGLCSSTESTRGCGWGSGVGAWAPWPSSPSPDAKPLAGNPPAATWVPEPLGC